jgi:hypothetical protein
MGDAEKATSHPCETRRRRLVKQRFLAKGVASLSRCILVGCAAVDGSASREVPAQPLAA